ncbi:MAG: hypothetical protein QOG20_2998 [Pseudonocardiales bacterium]|jgi:hypothetical protein|nr:hypothetical protein [Pseudonocardiales bacterium]
MPDAGTALVAAATWGLAMTGGPLSATLTGSAEAIGTGTTTVLGAALITIAANALKSGTNVNHSSDDASEGALPPTSSPPPSSPTRAGTRTAPTDRPTPQTRAVGTAAS